MIIKTKPKLIDYFFWIIFIIYTNPGGILEYFGENGKESGIDISDFLFFMLFGCYLVVFKKGRFVKDKMYGKVIKSLIIFSLYYLIVFCFFVPILKNVPNYSVFNTIIKIRHGIFNILLVVMIYEFYMRSQMIFFKSFLFSSIIVMILFIISFFSGFEILPVEEMNRVFVETKRLLMMNYGLMPILIPMGIVILIFKFDIRFDKIIVIGFFLMFIVWLLSLLRRNIFGTVIYFVVASFLFNYITHKDLIPFKKIISTTFYLIILFFILQLSFPKYVEGGYAAFEETIHIIQYGETISGGKDSRMGFGTKFIQNIIFNNPFFGTGFDNKWRTLDGDRAGYEATDYPFLSSLAMSGVMGVLFFLPIYIILIKMLIMDIRYLRVNRFDSLSFETYMLVLFIVYFIFDLMQYMNWFLPISIIGDIKWYVYLALYMASRNIFYRKKRVLVN